MASPPRLVTLRWLRRHLETGDPTGTATSADLRSATTADRLPADPRCGALRAGRSTETRRETGLGRHDGGAAGPGRRPRAAESWTA